MKKRNNTHQLAWAKDPSECLHAGSYQRVDDTILRDSIMLEHTQQIDRLLSQQDKQSSLFLKILQQRFLTREEWTMLGGRPSSGMSEYALMYGQLLKSRQLLSFTSNDHEQIYNTLLQHYLPKTNTFFFSPKPVPIPLSTVDRHLIITGRTGSGKTEFLKALFYQLQFTSQQKQQCSLILLDPHGDMAEQLFSLRLNLLKPERIWYIDPQLKDGRIPCLNPFWQQVNNPMLLDLMAQQWAKTFSELIPEIGMSLQMEALLKPCLAVLFHKGQCGLSDLQDFMDDQTNAHWVALGKQSSNPVYSSFFENAFLNKKYAPTKLAVYTRLQLLLNNHTFYQMMNGQSSIDLKKGMDEGKLILFNLSKGKLGEDTSKALGRFVSATLLSIALQRAFEPEHKRKPCYLFVDEFHNFVSSSMETVFSETRKYRLHLLVGTQTIGQLPLSLKEMVLNNTAVKLVGLNGLPALKSQAGDLGVSFTDLQLLPPFQFYLKIDHYPALKIKSPNHLIENKKKFFADAKEKLLLKNYLLDKSDLYRVIMQKERQQSEWKHNKNTVANTSPDGGVPNSSGTNEFKPKFGL